MCLPRDHFVVVRVCVHVLVRVRVHVAWVPRGGEAGAIPAQLGQLSRLIVLDLHDNQLSGESGASLADLVVDARHVPAGMTARTTSLLCPCGRG